MTMWAALIILLGLVCTVPGAPVSLCPKSCSCTAKGIYLEARCKSFDFLNKPLSPEQINSIMALDISNGSAVKINSNLRALRHLKRLNLASNKIQHFTATSLPKSLEYLDLSHNSIKHLPQDLHVLPALKELHIFGNPISCNCDSSYVRDALIKKGVIIPKSPKCEFPQEFRGKLWSLVACTHHGDAENLFEDMQGDAPYEGSGSGSGDVSLITESEPSEKSENWDSSIEDEFIVGSSVKAESSTSVELPSTETPEPELEGSGDEVEGTTSDFSIVSEVQETSTEAPKADVDEDEDEDEDENDYEDYDVTEAPTTVSEPPVVTEDISLLNRGIKACNFDCSTAAPVEDTDANDTEPAPGLFEGIQIIAKDLDIINDGETTSTTTSTEAPTTAAHAPKESAVDLNRAINTDKKNLSDAEVIKDDLNTDKETGNISEDPAKQQQSHTTFIFLSVLLVIIVCLVVYAIVKKRKMRRNRRGSITDKDPAKEAVPEEIELLKKPVSQTDKPNGTHEAIPLINGHNENQKNADEILPTDANNEMKPVEDDDDVELRPKKPDQQNLLTPETKRVTIKASEIPNSTPKTPILVTRHMNSDGSIVTTPNIDQHV